MATINGFGQFHSIRDTRGKTSQHVGGVGNTVNFHGDSGANTFRIDGAANNVDIKNIGRDEKIVLEGRPQDWQQINGDSRDGKVTYYNKVTGNAVTLQTDAGRNDAFVNSKVQFTGGYDSLAGQMAQRPCCAPNWNQLGNLMGNQHCFDPFGFGGMSNMFDTLSQGMFWNSQMALGGNCWNFNFNMNLNLF